MTKRVNQISPSIEQDTDSDWYNFDYSISPLWRYRTNRPQAEKEDMILKRELERIEQERSDEIRIERMKMEERKRAKPAERKLTTILEEIVNNGKKGKVSENGKQRGN